MSGKQREGKAMKRTAGIYLAMIAWAIVGWGNGYMFGKKAAGDYWQKALDRALITTQPGVPRTNCDVHLDQMGVPLHVLILTAFPCTVSGKSSLVVERVKVPEALEGKVQDEIDSGDAVAPEALMSKNAKPTEGPHIEIYDNWFADSKWQNAEHDTVTYPDGTYCDRDWNGGMLTYHQCWTKDGRKVFKNGDVLPKTQ
jgi:hypothetical protein